MLLVLPGSRRSEIRHHMAVFGQAVARLQEQGVAFELVLPTMPHLQEAVVDAVKSWPVQPQVVIGEQEKRAKFRIAHAALAKSGTVTLELALAGVPMVTAYRTGTVEAWILRRAIKVNSVILANLVIGENVVPEFLQEDCTPEKLAAALREVLGDSELRRKQLEAFGKIDGIMSTGNQPPSARAADIVLATMWKARRAWIGKHGRDACREARCTSDRDDGRASALLTIEELKKAGRDDRIRLSICLCAPLTSACPSRHNRGGRRRCRAGADGRSSAAGPRSSRSTG